MSFGQLIAAARKKLNLSQKELALVIVKEDGEPISPQYLNDLEHERRNPPSDFLLRQFSSALKIDLDVLYYHAGEMPADIRGKEVTDEKVKEAYKAFRKKLEED